MASSSCWRCLARTSSSSSVFTNTAHHLPAKALAGPTASVSLFSTSSRLGASPESGLLRGHVRAGLKNPNAKKRRKRQPIERSRVPKIGERKAFRTRIVLSNNNAIPVRDSLKLSAATIVDEANVGKVLALPADPLLDQLRASRAFKVTQTFKLFHSPHVLVRQETVDLANKMNDAARKKETLKMVLTGEKLGGKSTLLLQGIANAYLNNWLVINVPEGQEVTTAATEYGPIENTSPTQWKQPNWVLDLMQNLVKASPRIFRTLTTINSYDQLPNPVRNEVPLTELIDSAKEPDHAWAVWEALWTELNIKGNGRPPILLACDGLAHIMKVSMYRNQQFELIHSHDIALVRMFVDHMTGAKSFANGGAVICATSRNNHPRSPSTELALAQRLAEQRGLEVPKREPYGKGYDARVEEALARVEVMDVQGLSKPDARALMEYWAASGLLRERIDERAVADKWTLSGNGIVGEMERMTLLNELRV